MKIDYIKNISYILNHTFSYEFLQKKTEKLKKKIYIYFSYLFFLIFFFPINFFFLTFRILNFFLHFSVFFCTFFDQGGKSRTEISYFRGRQMSWVGGAATFPNEMKFRLLGSSHLRLWALVAAHPEALERRQGSHFKALSFPCHLPFSDLGNVSPFSNGGKNSEIPFVLLHKNRRFSAMKICWGG